MTEDSEFIEEVAIAEFLNRYQHLIDGSAKISPFEYRVMRTTYALILLDQGDRFSAGEVHKTIEVACALLRSGGLANFEYVVEPIIVNIESTQNFLNRCWETARKAEQRENIDEKIVGYLEYYKTLYEGLAPRTLASSIAALVSIGKLPEKIFKLTIDGKVDLRALNEVPNYLWAVRKRLSIGLNNHIRNSFSHDNYTILDGGLVELWDVNPSTGKIGWGPERRNSTQLRLLCKELWLNSLATYLSQLIFSINNRPIIDAGNYYKKYKPNYPERRISEIDSISRHLAEERSFTVKDCMVEKEKIEMKLATREAAMDQDEDVFVGSGSISRRYTRPVRNERVPVAEQAVGLLQRIENELDKPVIYLLKIIDTSDKEIGQIMTDSSFIKGLPKKGTVPFSKIRQKLQIDTLGDAIMNVEMKYPLVPS